MNSKLVYNFNTHRLSIVPDNEEINLDEEKVVPILQEEFYVMKVKGVCSSDNEFVLHLFSFETPILKILLYIIIL